MFSVVLVCLCEQHYSKRYDTASVSGIYETYCPLTGGHGLESWSYQDTRYKTQDDFIVFSCIQLYTYKTRMIFGH